MKRNYKRWVALMLSAVMLCQSGVSGYASEVSDQEQGIQLQEHLTSDEETHLPDEEHEIQPVQVLFELEELRDVSTKQYRMSDGSILAAGYGMDVHYENEDGVWDEIDNRFLYDEAETTDDFTGYSTAEGAVEYKFAPKVQEGELFRVSEGEYSVGFELVEQEAAEESPDEMTEAATDSLMLPENVDAMEAQVTAVEGETVPSESSFTILKGEVLNPEEIPQVMELTASEDKDLTTGSGNEVPEEQNTVKEAELPEVIWAEVEEPTAESTPLMEELQVENAVTSVGYGNVFPGVSLQYIMQGSSLKEYILINRQQEVYSYDFRLRLTNLIPEQQADGRILLKNAKSEEAVYEIPAGYMTDASGAYSDAVELSLREAETENGTEYILNVFADAQWINAEERVFPVQIDPTLNSLLYSANDIRASYVAEGTPED